MDIENKLIEHVKEKYSPVGILIHGSRANGNFRENSDWDFAIFVDNEIETEREIVLGQNIEIKTVLYKKEINNISEYVPQFRKGNIRIVYDPQGLCANFIELAEELFKKGRPQEDYSETEFKGHGAWMLSHIGGMIDYKDDQLAFFRKLSEFYGRALNYWFRFKKHDWMLQVYESIPRIKNEDPEYYELLVKISGNYTNEEKIEFCKEIHNKIFK